MTGAVYRSLSGPNIVTEVSHDTGRSYDTSLQRYAFIRDARLPNYAKVHTATAARRISVIRIKNRANQSTANGKLLRLVAK